MKTLLSFRGPAHHRQLMRPVEDALEQLGWRIVRFTVDTEGCFQHELGKEVGLDGYEWLPDYEDEKKALELHERAWPLFQKAYQEPNALSLILPQLLDRIVLSMCHEWTGIWNLLKKIKPTACLALHEINRWGHMMGHQATQLGIPLWTMQEGLYYNDAWMYTGHTRYSRSFVWGQATKKLLMKAGCPEEKLLVVGHTDLGRRWREASREDAHAQIPLEDRGRKIVFAFMTNVEVKDDAEGLFTGWEEQEEWLMVVRYHHLSSAPNIEKLKKLFAKKHVVVSEGGEEPFPPMQWRWMAMASACFIFGCSSLTLEWLARPEGARPLGIYRAPLMLKDYTEEGLALACDGVPFLEAVRKVEREWQGQCGEKAEAWVANELDSMDAAAGMAGIINRGK